MLFDEFNKQQLAARVLGLDPDTLPNQKYN